MPSTPAICKARSRGRSCIGDQPDREVLCHLARNVFNRHNAGETSKRCCFRAGERLAEHCKQCGVCPTSAFGQTPDHAERALNGGFSKSGDWAGETVSPGPVYWG